MAATMSMSVHLPGASPMSSPVASSSPSPASSSTASSSGPSQLGFSRRAAVPVLGVALLAAMRAAEPAMAKDIPLFGIRRRVAQVEEEVVEEVKELVKEGEQLVKEGEKDIVSAVKQTAAASSSFSGGESIPPLYQAGAVAGAELVALLVASSVVNGLVS